MTRAQISAAILSDKWVHHRKIEVVSTSFSCFCKAMCVWLHKPQVVNRRLCGAKLQYTKFHELISCGVLHDILLNCEHDTSVEGLEMNNSRTSGGDTAYCGKLVKDVKKISEYDYLLQNDINNKIKTTTRQAEEPVSLPSTITDFVDSTVTTELTGNVSSSDELYQNCENGNEWSHDTIIDREHINDYSSRTEGFIVVIRDLHPRELSQHPVLRELVLFDLNGKVVTFIPVGKRRNNVDGGNTVMEESCDSEISYRFQYEDVGDCSSISLSTSAPRESSKPHLSIDWLVNTLLPKVGSWSGESDLNTGITSLRLVPVDLYNLKYQQMKKEYGPPLVKIWPDSTDPQKFVYEDIAIATYLILLWEAEQRDLHLTKKQTFVDLGCGNGLLVYLLASHGYEGVGLDIRRRKIWDIFTPVANLQEQTITPSGDHLFTQYDWIIGNHSDELTPWIPVIAARSSYTTRYFVLPCCPHDFDTKFATKKPGSSVYQSYLEFVEGVGRVCGFNVLQDTLRIPSTKRVCFIGQHRSYPVIDEATVDQERERYIRGHCRGSQSQHSTSEEWTPTFNPREKTERVRNCHKVEKCTRDRVVAKVFDAVFKGDNCTVITADGRKWRKGGVVSVKDAVSLFDSDTLKQLKNECGGIQTLLRNQHHVFTVSGGNVALRDLTLADPWGYRSKVNKVDRSIYNKTCLCWYNDNHPDGCPLSSEKKIEIETERRVVSFSRKTDGKWGILPSVNGRQLKRGDPFASR